MQSSHLCIAFCLFLSASICRNHAFSQSETDDDSYSEHCSSVLPRYNVTARSRDDPLPFLTTPYFTGGDSLLRIDPERTNYYFDKCLRLRLQLRPDYYLTTAAGVYKVQGFLYVKSPYSPEGESINFPMNGFWSEESRKLCMVGSASLRGIDRDAVLKLKFADENPTIYSGVVSGSLESTASANDPPYFSPILIFSFPELSNYKYSLVTEKVRGAFPSQKDESLSLDAAEFCSVMSQRLRCLQLEYAKDCAGLCSPLGVGDGDRFLPLSLSLTSIQCIEGSKKARFMATFQNHSSDLYNSFGLASTVIGEVSWDGKNNRMIGVTCELLNPSHELGNAVGNCTTRFILRLPSVLTIRNDAKIAGQIWSSNGYFRQINLSNNDDIGELALPEQRYEYTELDRARKSCTKKPAKIGDYFPDGHSHDMRLDMNIKNGKGQEFSWASAIPIWVQNDRYQGSDGGYEFAAVAQSAAILEPEKPDSRIKISYRIRNYKVELQSLSNNITSPSFNWPVSPYGGVDVTAEGLYDYTNGHLCMVGCRRLFQNSTYVFKDCDVVVELDLPRVIRERDGLIKGVLRSTRKKGDPLHFDDLTLHSNVYYRGEAERSIWRMDMEIVMVLISNTLTCIFVALQIIHVKQNPEVPSSVSLVMLVILSIGHMIPLVLNFEAVYLGDREKRMVHLGRGGRLEANEVAVRVITMVAVLLQLRLFQLVWTAKQNRKSSWSGEKKAGFGSLLLYSLGALLALLLNWMRNTYRSYITDERYSVWGDSRSCAGLILDGFLVPQILLNVLRGSPEKALTHPFYVGISAVRLVPHAYNEYRAHNYPKFDLNSTYYYYALAVIVFVQQRHGGRCILPKRLVVC